MPARSKWLPGPIELGTPSTSRPRSRSRPSAGAKLDVDLVPCSATVTLHGLPAQSRARIKRSGHDAPVAVVRSQAGEDVKQALGPGSYDLIVVNEAREVTSGLTFAVGPGEQRTIDTTADARPRVRLLLPDPGSDEGGWRVSVSRGGPAGGASGAMAGTTFGSAFSGDEPAAMVDEVSPTEQALVFAGTGTFTVQCSRRSLSFRLASTIELGAGEQRTLALPPLSATLRGSMKTYDGDKGFSQHGTAGPRLVLLSAREQLGATGWDAIVSLPKRKPDGSFEIASLPSGPYHAFQHLVGEPRTYTDSKGKEHTFQRPRDAWGGVPVRLEADKVTEVADFASYPLGDLTVEVVDRAGHPLPAGLLRVRDRMSDAWQQVVHGGSTYAFAADPIPLPPAVPIAGGAARLASIRSGRLELGVELSDGRVVSATRDVELGKKLTLVLPLELPTAGER